MQMTSRQHEYRKQFQTEKIFKTGPLWNGELESISLKLFFLSRVMEEDKFKQRFDMQYHQINSEGKPN